jgi:hypothetical protein
MEIPDVSSGIHFVLSAQETVDLLPLHTSQINNTISSRKLHCTTAVMKFKELSYRTDKLSEWNLLRIDKIQ